MNRYEARRRWAPLVWMFVVMLALPPGALVPEAHATGLWSNALTREDAYMESFRNPQISSGQYNRFLMTQNPWELLAGGGEDLLDPSDRGNRWTAEPNAQWLTNHGYVEWTEQDLSLPGNVFDLTFSRVNRGSVESYNGPLGLCWDFNWNKRLHLTDNADPVPDTIELYDMGRVDVYTWDSGTSSWLSPAGRYDTFAGNASEYTRTDRYGIVETYAPSDYGWYRLYSMHDPGEASDGDGNVIEFYYSNGKLLQVTNDAGFIAQLSYDEGGRITMISDLGEREWKYDYDEDSRLTAVTSPVFDHSDSGHDYTTGRTTYYYYTEDDKLAGVSQPNDYNPTGYSTATWEWEFDSNNYVTRQYVNGQPIDLIYDDTNRRVTVDDRMDYRTVYEYDNATDRRITKRKVYYDATNSYDTTWLYNSDHEVTDVVFPLGNRIVYTYDGDGNVLTAKFKKDASDSTPIEWTYTYTTYSRLSTLTDPNGRTWDYDYDADGNLTRKAAPAVTLPSGIATTNLNAHLNSTYDGTIVELWEYDDYGNVTESTDATGTVRNAYYAAAAQDGNPKNLTKLIADPGTGKLNITYQWVYDGLGRAITYIDPGSNATKYEYNSVDELIEVTEPGGVEVTYYHDLNGNVVKTTEIDDNAASSGTFVSEMFFDRVNNITQLIVDQDASTRLTTTYEYDANDRLTQLNEPGSQVSEWVYDARDLRTSLIRRGAVSQDDAIVTVTYDANGNRTTITDPRSSTYRTILAYDGYDRLTRLTRPEGNYQVITRDAAGNVTGVASYNAGSTKLAEIVYAYDQANRHYQTETWAVKADLTTSLGGDGWQTRVLWLDENGEVLEVTGEGCGCALNEYVYDALGRLLTVLDAMPTSPTPSQQNWVAREYDLRGNMTRQIRRDTSQAPTTIEADNDVVVEFQYDQRNRMTKRRDMLATSDYADTSITYGVRDQVTRISDGAGRATKFEYNERLWPTKEWVDFAGGSSNDVVTEHLYDMSNRRITYRATNSSTGTQDTVYVYDPLWRLVATTWPDGGVSSYTYDPSSNRVSYTDPNSTLRVAQYDKNNRLTLQDHDLASNVVGATQLVFDYDGLDRLTAADSYEGSNFDSKIRWTYNTLGKIETEKQIIDGYIGGNGRTFTYAWDIDGQRTAMTMPRSGSVVTYTRDNLDRVDRISLDGTEVVDYTFSGPRIIRKQMPGSRATYGYDGLGRLTGLLHEDSSGTTQTLAQFQYGYDRGHQVTYMARDYYDDRVSPSTPITAQTMDKGDQYGYDDAGRLVTCVRGVPTAYVANAIADNLTYNRYGELVVYTYDQTGNRVSRSVTPQGGSPTVTTYAYNNVNEMTTEAGASQNYTLNGAFSGTSDAFKYDHADRLGEATPASQTYTYHYDALGRIVQRDHNSALSVRFYYDGLHVVEQNRWGFTLGVWSEAPRKIFVFGPVIDELLLYIDVNENPDESFYAHLDRLGSVHLLVDGNGDIKESYRYKEFGETTVVDGTFAKLTTTVESPEGNPHRYTGRRQDIQVGSYGDDWYDYRARVVRTNVGRFLSRDPLRYLSAGSNLYTYVRNRPTMSIDPLGWQDEPPGNGGQPGAGLAGLVRGLVDSTVDSIKQGLTPTERELFDLLPGDIQQAMLEAAAEALTATWAIGENPFAAGGAGNAMRHCTWACALKRRATGGRIPPGLGTLWMEIHEWPRPPLMPVCGAGLFLPPKRDSDTEHDDYNNDVGGKLGGSGDPKRSCGGLCNEQLNGGGLSTDDNPLGSGGAPPIDGTAAGDGDDSTHGAGK